MKRQTLLKKILADDFILFSICCIPFVLVDTFSIIYSVVFAICTYLIFGNKENFKMDNPDYSYKEIIILLVLTFVIQYFGMFYKLEWDQIFVGPYNFEFFPGFIVFYFYIMPIFYRMKIKKESIQDIGFVINKKVLLLILLSNIPIIIRIFYQIPVLKTAYPVGFIFHGLKAFYLPGLMEELYYRGFIFIMLRSKMEFIRSAIISSLIFTITHYNILQNIFLNIDIYFNIFNMIAIFILGFTCAYAYEKSKSLIPPIVFHGAIDGGFRFIIYYFFVYK